MKSIILLVALVISFVLLMVFGVKIKSEDPAPSPTVPTDRIAYPEWEGKG